MDDFDYSLIADASLVTGADEGARIRLNEDHLSIIAAFDNGQVLVATGSSNSDVARAVITSMIKEDIPFTKIVEVKSSTISELYNKSHGAMTSDDEDNLSRRKKLKQIIADAVKARASDIHLYIYDRHADIMFRIFNVMSIRETITPDEAKGIIEASFSAASGVLGQSSMYFRQAGLMPRSGLLPRGVSMLRQQYVPTAGGGSIVWRISYGSDPRIIDLAQLGYNEEQISEISVMKRRTSGLNILAGKVSSGKTTTLQRVVNGIHNENNGEISIYTIEDPIEIKLVAGTQFNATPQPDFQDPSKKIDGFTAGIAAALRFDINIAVLGEIRTHDVAMSAIQLALTGHALWTTVHAGSALQILERLSDLGVPKFRLADPDLMRGLIYQRLLGKICPHCRISYSEGHKRSLISKDLMDTSAKLFDVRPGELYLRGPGCGNCTNGIVGRTVVAEVIRPNQALLELFAKELTQAPVKEYWLRGKAQSGFGGLPVIHQALIKAASGLCDVNEVEKEVDLVSEYAQKYEHLVHALRSDISASRKKEGLQK